MSVLIKNGNIVTATDNYIADIFIEGETVKAIGKDLQVKAEKGNRCYPQASLTGRHRSACASRYAFHGHIFIR